MPTTKNYYQKLGEFIVKFNVLDNKISRELWILIEAGNSLDDVENFGKRITTLLEYNQKVELLDRLLIDNFNIEIANKFKPIKKDLISLGKIRNTYVHGEWLINFVKSKEVGGTEKISQTLILHDKKAFDRGGKVNYSKAVQRIDMDRLNKDIKKIENLTETMLEFYKFLGVI